MKFQEGISSDLIFRFLFLLKGSLIYEDDKNKDYPVILYNLGNSDGGNPTTGGGGGGGNGSGDDDGVDITETHP